MGEMSLPSTPFRPVANEELAFLGTGPVPAAPYYDPAYFELEREAVFRASWLHIGRVSEVDRPNRFIVRPIEVLNASVLVVHGADGQLRAFHNVCSHRGTQLVWEDEGSAASFSCHYHMWNYTNTGSLRAVPDAEHFWDLDKAQCGLKPIALDTCGGFLFVNLSPRPAQTLREFLGPMGERLDALGLGELDQYSEYTYGVEANWKSTYDNFQEVYHLRWVHDRTLGFRVTTSENPFGYPRRYFFEGPHRGMVLYFNEHAQRPDVEQWAFEALRASHGTTGSFRTTSDFLCVFPNLFVTPLPFGSFTQQMWPLGPDRTHSVIRLYWHGKDQDASMRFAREFAMLTHVDVHTEDRRLIEAAHRGLRSGVVGQVRFQAQEALCRHFFNEVDTRVRAHKAARSVAPAAQLMDDGGL
jgi:phenylpropionate dioxygenase-like ring-hydroxylating dioxygenase large terminal subunit